MNASAPARYCAKMRAPFGVVGIRCEGDAIVAIDYLPHAARELAPRNRLAAAACAQIERYFADPGAPFDLPLRRAGTEFQRRVWARIAAIPPGGTRAYGELARELRSSARAVGQACGANPYPIVIPCHRVVAAAGIGGFAHHAGGFHVGVKRWLLAHESGDRR
ncbi:MAG: methylated-DNA--[protein]-cysteine S-methyltransferase [Burkholderiales bacterium]|nr:methylated-DNA--[protein]-cysteine S-methyltransferase [Burkholderiales bacterium]